MVAADVNLKAIQDAMRHSSIRTTLDTYGHVLRAKQTERLAKQTEVMDQARARLESADGTRSVHDRFIATAEGAEEDENGGF